MTAIKALLVVALFQKYSSAAYNCTNSFPKVIKGFTFSRLNDIDANSNMIVGAGYDEQGWYSSGGYYNYNGYPFIISYSTSSTSINWAFKDTNANYNEAHKIKISPDGARIIVLYFKGEFLTLNATSGNVLSSKKLSNS